MNEELLIADPNDSHDIAQMKAEAKACLDERDAARVKRLNTTDPIERKLLTKQYDSARNRAHKLITKLKALQDPSLVEKLKEQARVAQAKRSEKNKAKTRRRLKQRQSYKKEQTEIKQKRKSNSVADLLDALEDETRKLAWRNERTWHNFQKKIELN